jgi:hypothetical protein
MDAMLDSRRATNTASAYATAAPASGNPPSLWRELADGSASLGVRIGVSVALAPLIAGAALWGSFFIAGIGPQFLARTWGGGFGPTDELVVFMLVLGVIGYLAGLYWLWTRKRHKRHEFWKAGLLTVAVVALLILLIWVIDETRALRGSWEVLVSGLVCIAGAAVILIWLQAWRRVGRQKPLLNPIDGAVDLRCPTCGYRMVGLRESRCPECGTSYTLDELVAQQEFRLQREMVTTEARIEPPGN